MSPTLPTNPFPISSPTTNMPAPRFCIGDRVTVDPKFQRTYHTHNTMRPNGEIIFGITWEPGSGYIYHLAGMRYPAGYREQHLTRTQSHNEVFAGIELRQKLAHYVTTLQEAIRTSLYGTRLDEYNRDDNGLYSPYFRNNNAAARIASILEEAMRAIK